MKSRGSDGSSNTPVTSNDAELFHQAVADVRPLNHNLAVPNPARKHPISAERTPRSTSGGEPPQVTEFGEELRYLGPGIQTSALQKLRRGQFPIEAALDLHGQTAAEASSRLQQFLLQSQAAGRRAVRIVHGKGYGSAGRRPVLKTRVNQLLQQCPFVLAFCSALPRDGGTGAVNVLLRK